MTPTWSSCKLRAPGSTQQLPPVRAKEVYFNMLHMNILPYFICTTWPISGVFLLQMTEFKRAIILVLLSSKQQEKKRKFVQNEWKSGSDGMMDIKTNRSQFNQCHCMVWTDKRFHLKVQSVILEKYCSTKHQNKYTPPFLLLQKLRPPNSWLADQKRNMVESRVMLQL